VDSLRFAVLTGLFASASVVGAQTAPCAGLPPGKHSVLEKMSADFGLTCEQQLKVEKLLHDEESVSRPLLRCVWLSDEQHRSIMLKVKLAARRQIRPLLTPDQQKLIDLDIENVAKAAKDDSKRPNRRGAPPATTDAFQDEETLSKAVMNYAALTPEDKKAVLLEVKRSVRERNEGLTTDQRSKLDSEIAELSNR